MQADGSNSWGTMPRRTLIPILRKLDTAGMIVCAGVVQTHGRSGAQKACAHRCTHAPPELRGCVRPNLSVSQHVSFDNPAVRNARACARLAVRLPGQGSRIRRKRSAPVSSSLLDDRKVLNGSSASARRCACTAVSSCARAPMQNESAAQSNAPMRALPILSGFPALDTAKLTIKVLNVNARSCYRRYVT